MALSDTEYYLAIVVKGMVLIIFFSSSRVGRSTVRRFKLQQLMQYILVDYISHPQFSQ